MRARGLKLLVLAMFSHYFVSRPMRARGLKPRHFQSKGIGSSSRPMRARGLKQKYDLKQTEHSWVAPHAGAWVETYLKPLSDSYSMSRPMRARGLKQIYN